MVAHRSARATLYLILAAAIAGAAHGAFTCLGSDDAATCTALSQFWDATGGPGWTTQTVWSSFAAGTPSGSICTLYYLAPCDGNSRITRMYVQLRSRRQQTLRCAGSVHCPLAGSDADVTKRASHPSFCCGGIARVIDVNRLTGSLPDTLGSFVYLTEMCCGMQVARFRSL
jgi:hypothetical protein